MMEGVEINYRDHGETVQSSWALVATCATHLGDGPRLGKPHNHIREMMATNKISLEFDIVFSFDISLHASAI